MNLAQQLYEALDSLAANKLRSGLTMLGIVIGVAAVIAMLAIGEGAQASINTSIEGIGTNLLFVTAGANGVDRPNPLTMGDANALADPALVPDISAVAPLIQGRGLLSVGGKSETTSVSGVTPEYAPVRNMKTSEGSFFTQSQYTGRSAVAVIGSQTAINLFGKSSGVTGQTFRINAQPFRVVGVLEAKGGSNFGNQDDVVLVPLTTAQSRLFHRSPPDRVDLIMASATKPEVVQKASAEVRQVLRSRHHLGTGADDFTMINQQDILATASSITGVFTLFLGGIAAISLLVGGIGIMNIMLVSVTERTREIGLRKAIGARRIDILAQFLVESLLLSVLGGAVGIGVAWLISAIIAQIAASSGTPFSPVIGANAILLATIFSAAVGIFFGLYPALRAANLEPAEALRSE
jgi:putative ABC transport system permease protein